MTGAIDDLTEGQKDCLRLFYGRYDAKEIGRRLGIAPSTVHQRLTAARKTLGVARSMEAARLLIEAEQPAYEGVLYDEITVAQLPPNRLHRAVARLPWPWPTRWRPVNDLTLGETLVAILGIAVVFMVAVALYVLAVRELGRSIL